MIGQQVGLLLGDNLVNKSTSVAEQHIRVVPLGGGPRRAEHTRHHTPTASSYVERKYNALHACKIGQDINAVYYKAVQFRFGLDDVLYAAIVGRLIDTQFVIFLADGTH